MVIHYKRLSRITRVSSTIILEEFGIGSALERNRWVVTLTLHILYIRVRPSLISHRIQTAFASI